MTLNPKNWMLTFWREDLEVGIIGIKTAHRKMKSFNRIANHVAVCGLQGLLARISAGLTFGAVVGHSIFPAE